MMQNNYDFDDVIRMVNDNHERYIKSLTIKKEESKKFKSAKINKIKVFKNRVISIAIGTLIIYSSSLIGNVNLDSYINQTQASLNVGENIQTNIDTSSQIVSQSNEITNLYNEYSENLEKEVETKEQVLIKKYCNEVFGLKYDVVYEIASRLTNNFTSEEYFVKLNMKCNKNALKKTYE